MNWLEILEEAHREEAERRADEAERRAAEIFAENAILRNGHTFHEWLEIFFEAHGLTPKQEQK